MIEIIGYISIVFPWLLGMVTIFYWIKPNKKPADESNRINSITSWWIGLTRTEVIAISLKYFRNDVLENIKKVQEQNND